MRVSHHSSADRRGLTLIELLVVIGVIALLVSLTLPAVQAARSSARRVQCLNHLRQLGLALHNYHDAHSVLPPGAIVKGPGLPIVFSGWGWGAMILPQFDHSPLYNSINFELGTAVGANEILLATPLPAWDCPADTAEDQITVAVDGYPTTQVATGNYAGCQQVLGPLSDTRLADFVDGLSQTFMAGERVNQSAKPGTPPFTAAWCGFISKTDRYIFSSTPYTTVSWAYPINFHLGSPQNFSSRHGGGAQFVFGDGAARFLSAQLDAQIFQSLGTPAGGEIAEY